MPNPPRYGMIVDVERCTGCHACAVACKVENDVPLGNYRIKTYYHDRGRFPDVKRFFLPAMCMHCADAPCLNACPTKSIARGPDGIVKVNGNTCRGNGDCEDACPYGAIYVDPQRNVADKCDWCSHRLEVGMEPACVETCPADVFLFGDLNNPKSQISQFRERQRRSLTVLKAEEKTDPQTQYRGVERDMERKIPKGRNHDPRSYEIETWAGLESTFDREGGGRP